jgi:ribosome-binding factor A
MASVRLEKVASLLKRELSLSFQRGMNIHYQGVMITVTQVRVSPDLGLAKVYLSFFPAEKRASTLELVQNRTVLIRKELAAEVAKQLRKVPDLAFYLDDSLDYFEEIDRLLKGD